jgi:hypothetical protein
LQETSDFDENELVLGHRVLKEASSKIFKSLGKKKTKKKDQTSCPTIVIEGNQLGEKRDSLITNLIKDSTSENTVTSKRTSVLIRKGSTHMANRNRKMAPYSSASVTTSTKNEPSIHTEEKFNIAGTSLS